MSSFMRFIPTPGPKDAYAEQSCFALQMIENQGKRTKRSRALLNAGRSEVALAPLPVPPCI